MDEFTDGLDNADQQEENTVDVITDDQETADGQTGQTSPLPTDVPETAEGSTGGQEADIPSGLEDAEQNAEITPEPELSPSPAPDYEELLKELQMQTAEIKAIREVTDKQADHNTSMENIGFVSIVGISLLCGFVAALIFSNYIRH